MSDMKNLRETLLGFQQKEATPFETVTVLSHRVHSRFRPTGLVLNDDLANRVLVSQIRFRRRDLLASEAPGYFFTSAFVGKLLIFGDWMEIGDPPIEVVLVNQESTTLFPSMGMALTGWME